MASLKVETLRRVIQLVRWNTGRNATIYCVDRAPNRIADLSVNPVSRNRENRIEVGS